MPKAGRGSSQGAIVVTGVSGFQSRQIRSAQLAAYDKLGYNPETETSRETQERYRQLADNTGLNSMTDTQLSTFIYRQGNRASIYRNKMQTAEANLRKVAENGSAPSNILYAHRQALTVALINFRKVEDLLTAATLVNLDRD